MFKEFRTFIARGNVIDLAVAVIIGAAFGKIVSSLVADVIMPPLGMAIGGVDFKEYGVTLAAAGADGKPVILKYGVFLQTIFEFLIIALALFIVIKGINKLKRPPPPSEPSAIPPTKTEALLEDIRNLLAKQTR